jgi:hypothetical protein
MNTRSQRLCAWSGPLFALLFFLGYGVIARFIPPPDPADTAQVVADRYREHANAIRTGMLVSMYALVFYVPFVAAISLHVKRIEGRFSPLAYAELGLGVLLPVEFLPSLYFFQNAAYRPERANEAVQQLNDMGWLPFTGIIFTIFVQNVVIGIAVLSDNRDKPIFPRWYGYFSIWCGLLYCPASLDVYFKDGPLAWNGILSWWLSLISFFAWLVVTTVVVLRAITDQAAESVPAEPVNRRPSDVGSAS